MKLMLPKAKAAHSRYNHGRFRMNVGATFALKESLHIILMTIVFFEINQLHSLGYTAGGGWHAYPVITLFILHSTHRVVNQS